MYLRLSVIALLLVIVIVAAITIPIAASQGRRLSALQERLDTQQAWLAVVERGTHTSVLTIDRNAIQLHALDGSLERTWPKNQLVSADQTQVQRGAFRRPGLRLQFADHGIPTGDLAVLFPSRGGLMPSSRALAEVRAALLG